MPKCTELLPYGCANICDDVNIIANEVAVASAMISKLRTMNEKTDVCGESCHSEQNYVVVKPQVCHQ